MAEIIPLHREKKAGENKPVAEVQPLWREALGRSLRTTRAEQGERLVDIADRAGISPQYLSEIERGRKEPSSEMIEAVAGALGTDLAGVLGRIASDLHRARPAAAGPVLLLQAA
ncbi:helix-turn-helix domain-containing protein [Antrihabitans sp. YC2-6]|uniref:helix-turn-helix domain-containing protein n=1 Tax=Antrihabitans sp. YC2-6 TaxID=2799498 RepID=UPI0018F6B5A0|nr:helix-turn-helix transcriptional regulator [Antrihabitans sp. YC2-6]MBJ8343846.1 helix-turn-helix transcriptional regulator [Antrihabitans sp. YC2-6]